MSKFVALAVLCVFGAVVVRGFDKQEIIVTFMANLKECKEEVGAKESDIEELLGRKPSSTMEGKCLRACIMKKFGVLDNNGKFAKETVLTHAKQLIGDSEDIMKTAVEIIDTCSSIEVPADHCEAGEQYGKCFKEQLVLHNIDSSFGI